ncbi:lectin [Mucilaginibacter limnophilus]|uniref:Lectin n=1 Tax=Mucilaginibacter limnophilus TaxID=1932778 RepID=A0A3S2V9C7_9SPHI|nr:lectin [Mucilaginibacter limnophilus]RVU01870.1 lectin [Mucilaginibacter limnophilus]
MKKVLFLLFAFVCALISACKKDAAINNQNSAANVPVKRANASPPGDVVGKVVVGYQGWFAAVGDGSPINQWWHWAPNWGATPSASNNGIKSWPDVRDYTTTFQTGWANLNNGSQARLFSSYTTQTVNKQFEWMQQNNIDCAALQRFNPTGGEGPVRDAITAKVRDAAQTYGRKFYIMYDVTNWTNMQSEIKTDWTNKMSAYTSSTAYAKQNGKPVVCIWGFGFNDPGRPFSAAACLDVINWFKAQGCYVIGGVPREWRTGVGGSRAGYINVYHAFNMLSPWLIGAVGNVGDADNIYNQHMISDQADCNANGIDYQPCVLPGDLQLHQRAHGDLMWRMFYNAVRVGAQSIYISMFDEYNEGNQIAKTAESSAFIPAGSNFVTLDEDGTPCSSDYYLRLTGDGGRMLKGQIALTATRPTQPIVGGGGTGNPPIGQTITLKSANNLYVCSENGTQAMNANRTAVGGWEQFAITSAGSGKVALQNSGKYVSSENGTQAITCNRTAVGPWEQFDWINNGDGTISLRGSNGRYVSSEGGTQAMTCNRTTIGSTEKFRVNQ